MKAVTILGKGHPTGAYVLRIVNGCERAISFGRYRQGAPVSVPAGNLLYVGSAMAQKGSMTLARRLLRHATRAAPHPPHAIRPDLLAALRAAGMAGTGLTPPPDKRLFWNIDYLLNSEGVQLLQILILRANVPLEQALAQKLGADPSCTPLAPGLGAHDHPGSAHLLIVQAGEAWWRALPGMLAGSFAGGQSRS